MTYSNKPSLNFSGGEVSPGVLARADLPLFNKVLARMQNFIAEPQGPARYRNGTLQVTHTRNNNTGVFIEFQFSDIQAYLIEATEGYFRFYKDGAIILNSTYLTITDITNASPAVVTYTGADPVEGQEVFIENVAGMLEVNGRFFTIDNLDTVANTFELNDEFGNDIDASDFNGYDSGGKASVVYEVKTPYLEDDLVELKFAQNADTMYITHRNYDIRKLTRSAHDAWTLTRYTRTTNPIIVNKSTSTGNITAITQANPGVLTDAGHEFENGQWVFITQIQGMVELNDRWFKISNKAAGSYKLADVVTGVEINTTSYTAYTGNGISQPVEAIGHSGNPSTDNVSHYPAAVGFTDDARLGLAGSLASPETMWFSRGPSAAGAVRFDDFTTGTNANDALTFTLAPIQGKVDSIQWLINTDKYIALGCFGSVRRVFGETEAAPISTTAITAKGANSDGVNQAAPVVAGPVLFYIGRSGLTIESLEYDYQVDGYSPDDKNLVTAHLTVGGLIQLKRQVGRPSLIWAVRADGVLLALTYINKENISGWHRHYIGGDGVVENIGIMPRENAQDQLWMIVKRTINGNTVRYVEYLTDPPDFPDMVDFFTGETFKNQDWERYLNYQSEIAKHAIHLDSAITYDGSAYGTDADATITLGQDADVLDAEGITVTASHAVFTEDMVGREIWGAYTNEGIGGGRLEITAYTSTTVVSGTIIDTFPATATYEAGDWFITATEVSNILHLEGESVGLITDGAVPENQVVENGTITLDDPASMIHIGYRYRGILKTVPLDQGGITGPAQNKMKTLIGLAIRFINATGVQFGTSLYRLAHLDFRLGSDFTGRPVPLFNGAQEITYQDEHARDKEVYIVQDQPLPCTISSLDLFMDTADEL